MKNICFFVLLLCNSCIISQQKKIKVEKIVIDFQDFFKNDTVSIYFNNCQLFENKILNSNQVLGHTGVTLQINNQNDVMLGNTALNIHCTVNLKLENEVNIILNGNMERFIIDLSKGIYIGFDKKEKHLYLLQSKMPFEYD
jgi:hypothetical protein